MRAYDLIEKKKLGKALTKEEISFLLRGYVSGEIPDYQMSAFAMAVCFQGMEKEEITDFTLEMAASGDQMDLSDIPGFKVDKHSTGGVGDKTSMVIGPIVAACGVKVAKMSGRGLGHTGGTIDKLESIPGFSTELSEKQFFDVVKKVGISVAGQTGNLVPADKKLYALRDVTATVDSIPLIASSVMSKKLAAGADGIVLDVKCGSGAFMKTPKEAHLLAETMVKIGEQAGRKVAALITNMDRPLGNCVGNNLEVIEAAETLKGRGPKDLTDLSVELAAWMLRLSQKGSLEQCRNLARDAVSTGAAFQKFLDFVEAQGGAKEALLDYSLFKKAKYNRELFSHKSGFLTHMNTEECGNAAMVLGAGRSKKEDPIDLSAGIVFYKKTGDAVSEGEVLAILYSDEESRLCQAEEILLNAVSIEKEPLCQAPLIYETVFHEL